MQEKHKKNWVLRIASLALVFTLMSTCLLGSTLAKYITQGSGSDTARVAKWGVKITSGESLFDTKYKTDDNTSADTGTYSVISSSSDKVLAPGTSGTAAAFTVSGTPEVACTVDISNATLTYSDAWTAVVGSYRPILWTLKMTDSSGNTETIAETSVVADLITALKDCSADYAPNTSLNQTYTISWAWPFSSTGNVNDTSDTALGDAAAVGADLKVNLNFTVNVTQID